MDRIPFDPYDFFGYLASGLVVIVGMDLVFGFPHVLGQEFKVVESGVLILAVYVVGQVIATPAKAILEDMVVGRILGRPSVNLFKGEKPFLLGLLFPGYYQSLPEQTRKRILDRAESEGVSVTGEALFLHVRYSPVIRDDQKLMEKLSNFLNKYGFNRNVSFSALLVGSALVVKTWASTAGEPDLLRYAVVSLVAGVLLFYRYLKFFRQYSYEMFNTYAQAK